MLNSQGPTSKWLDHHDRTPAVCQGRKLWAEEGTFGYAWNKLQEGTGEDHHKLYGNAGTLFLYANLKKLLNNKTMRTTHMNTKGVFFFCRKFVHLNNPSYSKSTVMVQKKKMTP